jgi:hypothetical protein
MSIRQFVEANTILAPGRGMSIAPLRRQYQNAYGPAARSAFIIALSEAGYAMLVDHEKTLLIGRVLAPVPVPA